MQLDASSTSRPASGPGRDAATGLARRSRPVVTPATARRDSEVSSVAGAAGDGRRDPDGPDGQDHDHDRASSDAHDHAAARTRHIYVYSPSGAVRDKAAFRRGLARLRAHGHAVEVDTDALASHQRFAGDDAARIAAIHRAAASGADVALISRGGYGIGRILDALDYKVLARAAERGTRFVGLSDFTALQSALLARKGAVTWAGPALCADFGVDGTPDDIMEDCFEDLLAGRGEGAGWRMPKPRTRAIKSAAADAGAISAETDFYCKKALLWGGNLAVLASLVGTRYLPDIKGGVLFLEDVNEHPYRIERMLTQLLQADVLRRQKAIVLGHFTGFQLTPHDKGFGLQGVVDWLRTQLRGRTPVFQGLPFGHVPTKVMLPVGARVSLSVEGRDALLYWGHV